MSARRSLRFPILLAIVMIALLALLTIGWVLLNVSGALQDERSSGLYWALLTVGSLLSLLLLVGTVLYLILSIKAINLTRRQSNFIDSVTHELKSPIASMKLYLQTLGRLPVGAAERADFYRFMLEDLERLDRLINQLLTAGRLEAETVDSPLQDVELEGLLRECADAVCLSYRVPRETVRVVSQPCWVRARRMDLEIIFRNLIDNAVKYAGAPPRVEVTAGTEGPREVVVLVSDNGRGIPFHLRRRVFRRFERLGLELERDKPGTGLGLYIVRTLLQRLRGRVHVRTPKAGPGTVLEVRLPGRPAAETRAPAEAVNETPPLAASKGCTPS
ncbi:MAG: HAMP domain-containing histidine kinase [Candidatus Anammoximicrobium sp.]|nr:HAMP domain-containing histidine kinase [Candidatus Anammoximicrobium sp.]